MSVSDPSLKKLKGYLYALRTETKPVNDRNTNVQLLCETLEGILRKGMKRASVLWGHNSYDYWDWISTLSEVSGSKCNPIFSMAIELIKKSKRVKSSQGRGRWFIRCALQKKILSVPIEQMTKNKKLLQQWYDPLFSVIGNDILLEIFMSLLYELTEIKFKLNTLNASFLDETWKRPLYMQLEFVPCVELGIKMQFVGDRVIVIYVEPGSVAAEDDKIQVGDVLDELFGESLLGVRKGRISSLMKQNQGWPIELSICKYIYPDGSMYLPIATLLNEVGLDRNCLPGDNKDTKKKDLQKYKPPPHAQLPDDGLDDVPVQSPDEMASYKVKFIGKIDIGDYGGMSMIEDAIDEVLRQDNIATEPYSLSLGETEIIIKNQDNEEFMRPSYTEISACGRRMDCVEKVAFILGETTCTLAKVFVCYVFEAENDEESKTILCSIAQGFGRTHWFV